MTVPTKMKKIINAYEKGMTNEEWQAEIERRKKVLAQRKLYKKIKRKFQNDLSDLNRFTRHTLNDKYTTEELAEVFGSDSEYLAEDKRQGLVDKTNYVWG